MVLNPTWSTLGSAQLLSVMLPLNCYLMFPFCRFHSCPWTEGDGLRRLRLDTQAGLMDGRAPGSGNFLDGCGKFSGWGCSSR